MRPRLTLPAAAASTPIAVMRVRSVGTRPKPQKPPRRSTSAMASSGVPAASRTGRTRSVAAGVVQHTTATAPSAASSRAKATARAGSPASSRTSTRIGVPNTPRAPRACSKRSAATAWSAPVCANGPVRETMTPTCHAAGCAFTCATEKTRRSRTVGKSARGMPGRTAPVREADEGLGGPGQNRRGAQGGPAVRCFAWLGGPGQNRRGAQGGPAVRCFAWLGGPGQNRTGAQGLGVPRSIH